MRASINLLSAAVLCFASLAMGGAEAQVRSLPYKVVRSGVALKLTAISSINPDCSSRGRSDVRLLTAPRGGQVFTRSAMDYPALPATDPAFPCDRRRVSSTDLFYRSYPGFRGPDAVDVEIVFPTGTARRAHYDLSVE